MSATPEFAVVMKLAVELHARWPESDCLDLVLAAHYQPEGGGPIVAGDELTGIEIVASNLYKKIWVVTTAEAGWVAGCLDELRYQWRQVAPEVLDAVRATLGTGWLTPDTSWADLGRLVAAVEAVNR